MAPKKYTITPFMEQLEAKMTEHGLTENSRLTYLRVIENLAGKPIDDLSSFLNVEWIEEKLAHLKPNTRRVYYTSIHSALKLTYLKKKDDGTEEYADGEMGGAICHYHKKMMRIAQAHKEIANKKSPVQSENWIEWNDVIDKWDEMKEQYDTLKIKQVIKHDYEYHFLLHFVILTLYVKLLPRRNADYLFMTVSQKRPEIMDEEQNYLILDEKKFIFHKYKTAGNYGCQEVQIPDEILDIIYFYIFSRKEDIPSLGVDLKKGKTCPFLLYRCGTAFTTSNGITRCLNKVFRPKKIGCCMLRTIFATEMLLENQEKSKAIAEGMGHSVSTQQNIYVKH
jgi:integrase